MPILRMFRRVRMRVDIVSCGKARGGKLSVEVLWDNWFEVTTVQKD